MCWTQTILGRWKHVLEDLCLRHCWGNKMIPRDGVCVGGRWFWGFRFCWSWNESKGLIMWIKRVTFLLSSSWTSSRLPVLNHPLMPVVAGAIAGLLRPLSSTSIYPRRRRSQSLETSIRGNRVGRRQGGVLDIPEEMELRDGVEAQPGGCCRRQRRRPRRSVFGEGSAQEVLQTHALKIGIVVEVVVVEGGEVDVFPDVFHSHFPEV